MGCYMCTITYVTLHVLHYLCYTFLLHVTVTLHVTLRVTCTFYIHVVHICGVHIGGTCMLHGCATWECYVTCNVTGDTKSVYFALFMFLAHVVGVCE